MQHIAVSEYFYESIWKSSVVHESSADPTPLNFLIFSNANAISTDLVSQVAKNHNVYQVQQGIKFTYDPLAKSFTIAPANQLDYVSLTNSLSEIGIKIDQIIHLWLINDPEPTNQVTIDSINKYQELGFLSMLYMAQQHSIICKELLTFTVITNGLYSVLGNELLNPEKATIQGLITCVPQEYPKILCRAIDVNPADLDQSSLINKLISEIYAKVTEVQLAYRNNMRWIKRYEKASVTDFESHDVLQQGGTYLITGGLGKIGLLFAKYLAKNFSAKLVLLGRSEFPAKELWEQWLADHDQQNIISKQIQTFKELETWGATVVIANADVTNAAQLLAAFQFGLDKFGRINGVLHLAGETKANGYAYIPDMQASHLNAQLLPKAYGLLELNNVIAKLNLPLDFVLLTSSLSVVLGGLQLGAYAGANAFMDGFAKLQEGQNSTIWFSPNLEGGEASETEQALAIVLANPHIPDLVMAITPLDKRLQQWLKRYQPAQAEAIQPKQNLYTRPELEIPYQAPKLEIETKIAECWQAVLGIANIGINDNFYDLGGNSLNVLQLQAKLINVLKTEVKVLDLFTYPTIADLSKYLFGNVANTTNKPNCHQSILFKETTSNLVITSSNDLDNPDPRIAIIGYSGVFPESNSIAEFWQNIQLGKDCIKRLSKQQCLALGVPENVVEHKNYIGAAGILADLDKFDADFWGLSVKDASLMDPQIRLFLQHAWKALEMSGYIKSRSILNVGVFAGAGDRQYFYHNIMPRMAEINNEFKLFTQSIELFIASRVGYFMNLHGPILNINTACSTSLVAIVEACEKLAARKCDLAIAGGASIFLPQKFGYIHRFGMFHSADGYTRTFDQDAKGTVFSSGVGTVVLKRYSDAVKDRDYVLAILAGYAINNDGNRKVSFAAPSVLGQKECILAAQKMAGISSDLISYVECHGTATPIGDSIEVKALTEAFKENTNEKRTQNCAIGSVKANIGHPDTAAGVAGLIKVCGMLQAKHIPPQINFNVANSKLELDLTPFEVVTSGKKWMSDAGQSRIAGLSSFGVGGTNAHVIIEEAPALTKAPRLQHPAYLLAISAKSVSALQYAKLEFAEYLNNHPEQDLADVAYTLHIAREEFKQRSIYICNQNNQAAKLFVDENYIGEDLVQDHNVLTKASSPTLVLLCCSTPQVSFGMAHELYNYIPFFKEQVDTCSAIANTYLAADLREYMFNKEQFIANTDEQLDFKYNTLAWFVLSYATAMLWRRAGINPSIILGYGIGKYLAQCLVDHLSLAEALHSLVNDLGSIVTNSTAVVTAETMLDYWDNQIGINISIADAIKNLQQDSLSNQKILLNIYPCHSLVNILLQQPIQHELLNSTLLHSTIELSQNYNSYLYMLQLMGKLWLHGTVLDWRILYEDAPHYLIPLPTYVFEKNRYWL